MINSVWTPSADLGFGLVVRSPKKVLNFSFKPESLLAGLAIVGRGPGEGSSAKKKEALETAKEQLPTPESVAAVDLQPHRL